MNLKIDAVGNKFFKMFEDFFTMTKFTEIIHSYTIPSDNVGLKSEFDFSIPVFIFFSHSKNQYYIKIFYQIVRNE